MKRRTNTVPDSTNTDERSVQMESICRLDSGGTHLSRDILIG